MPQKFIARIKSSNPYAVLSLVAANAVPIWFAVSSGIKPADLIFLYWLETWIIAFYTSLKIKKSEAPMTEPEKNWMRAQLFASHDTEPTRESILRVFIKQFFLIIIFFGAFLFGFLAPQIVEQGATYADRVFATIPKTGAAWIWILSSTAGFFVSHGISYSSNFLAKQEYLKTSPARQSLMLGDRLIAMFVFLMLGDVFSGAFADYKVGVLFGIALIKLVADLASHSKEHMIAQALVMGNNMSTRFGTGTFRFFVGGKRKL